MLDPTLDYGEQLPRTAAEQARELLDKPHPHLNLNPNPKPIHPKPIHPNPNPIHPNPSPSPTAEQARELLGARGIVAPPKAAKQPPTLAAHGKAEFEKAEAAVAEAYAEGAEAYAAEAEAEAEAEASAVGGGLGEALPPAGFEWGVTA